MFKSEKNERFAINPPDRIKATLRSAVLCIFVTMISAVTSIKTKADTMPNSDNMDSASLNNKNPENGFELDSEMFEELSKIFVEYDKIPNKSELIMFKVNYERKLRYILKILKMRYKFFSALYKNTQNIEIENEVADYKKLIRKIEKILKSL